MIKTSIIGCGKIADAHAAMISLIPDCEIVSVCDKEELMAKQLSERYRIKQYFCDTHEMLEKTRPNVVHITTPPQSHFELGRTCLSAGCHVFIEKPFTINTSEAEQLIRLANEKNLKLTVGTDEQYSHVAIRMRKLIQDGYLGGTPIHMEDIYCYDLGGNEHYVKAILGDKTHWVRRLPGRLLHNNISHGIAKIAEYISGDNLKINSHGFTSPFLKSIKEYDIIDELRVFINDDDKTTAYFTFSSRISPGLREFRIFGPKNGIIIDLNRQSLIKLSGKRYTGYLENFIPLSNFAKQYRKNMFSNAKLFLRREFHMKSGLKLLIKAFYEAIQNGSAPPISYKEILLTSKIMDTIFGQIYK